MPQAAHAANHFVDRADFVVDRNHDRQQEVVGQPIDAQSAADGRPQQLFAETRREPATCASPDSRSRKSISRRCANPRSKDRCRSMRAPPIRSGTRYSTSSLETKRLWRRGQSHFSPKAPKNRDSPRRFVSRLLILFHGLRRIQSGVQLQQAVRQFLRHAAGKRELSSLSRVERNSAKISCRGERISPVRRFETKTEPGMLSRGDAEKLRENATAGICKSLLHCKNQD